MHIFKGRYFFIACLTFISCSVLSLLVLPTVKLIISFVAIAAAITAVFVYIYNKSTKGRVVFAIMLCAAIFLSSFSSYVAFDAGYMAEGYIVGSSVELEAVVISEEYSSSNMSGYSVRVEKINGDNKSYLAILDCKYISEVKSGDRIVATVTAREFDDNIDGYLEKQSRLADGYYLAFESDGEDSYEIIDREVFDFRSFFEKLNFNLSYKLRTAIGGEEGNLAVALLLGNKDYLSDTTIRDFSRSGVSHILALSGMHMVIIMGLLELLLRLVRTPKPVRAIFLIVASVFYLMLTGMSMSATRSVLMLVWVYLSMLFSYKSDALTNLSFAGAVILLIWPRAVLSISFWMSFAATFGILVFMPIFNELFDRVECENKLLRFVKKAAIYVIGLFATTLCAFIGLVLVICVFTKEFAIYTMLASAVLTIPSSCIILFSLILPAFSFVTPIRSLLIGAIRTCGAFSIDFCSDISIKENIVYSLNYDFLIYFAIAFAVVFAVSLIINLKRKHLVLLMYVPIIAAFIFTVSVYNANNANKVEVTYLNASSRSDLIVVANDRNAIICDLSNGSKSSFSTALEVVDSSRASEITAIMLTDYHSAHIPTLSNIFKSRIVRQLWLPIPDDEESYFRMLSILDVANENNVKVRMYGMGDTLYAFAEVEIVLEQSYIDRSTVPISVMSIECNDSTVTYLSPAYVECERRDEFESIIGESDYLIAGTRGPNIKAYYTVGEAANVKEIVIPNIDTAIYLDTGSIAAGVPIYLGATNKCFLLYRDIVD